MDPPPLSDPSAGDPKRWRQQAAFSIFVERADLDTQAIRTRIYHEESGDDTVFRGFDESRIVRWMLQRIEGNQDRSTSGAAANADGADGRQSFDVRVALRPSGDGRQRSTRPEIVVHVDDLSDARRALGLGLLLAGQDGVVIRLGP